MEFCENILKLHKFQTDLYFLSEKIYFQIGPGEPRNPLKDIIPCEEHFWTYCPEISLEFHILRGVRGLLKKKESC